LAQLDFGTISLKDKQEEKLRPKDFGKKAPGKLVQDREGYWTYEPDPLPPELRFELTLVRQLTQADHALGELAGVGRMLPNPHLLIGPFLRREAILSSRIEGTVTRLEQLLPKNASQGAVLNRPALHR
jgi:hypothetical protein